MKYLVMIILLVCGCTICENPYIKSNGDCCLDNNNNSVCDEQDGIIISAPADTQTDKPIPKYEMWSSDAQIMLYSDYYTLKKIDELEFFISDQQISGIESVLLTMIPLCEDNHELEIRLNTRVIEKANIECGSGVTIDIDLDEVETGANVIEFSGRSEPYSVQNASVTISFGNNTVAQGINSFVMELPKKQKTFVSEEIRITNYHDFEFYMDDRNWGATTLELGSDKSTIIILLNDEFIYNGAAEGILTLPEKNLKMGENLLRYIYIE